MKKLFTAAMAAALMAAPAAMSARTLQALTKIVDPEFDESISYTYDDAGHLTRVDELLDGKYFYEYAYNEKGECIRQTGNQFFDSYNKYYAVFYVDYVYNEKGLLIERLNYSNMTPWNPMSDWTHQGVQYFSYNDKDQLILFETYIGRDKTNLLEKKEYVYNDKGQLTEINETYPQLTGNDLYGNVKYTYDDLGQLVEVCTSSNDEDHPQLLVRNYTIYTYDEEGNMIERIQTGSSRNTEYPMVRYTFTYDVSVPATDCLYPSETPEEDFDREMYLRSKCQVIGQDYWLQGADDPTQYAHLHSWEYYYDPKDINGGSGISGVVAEPGSLMFVTVDGDRLNLHGQLNENAPVSVYDLNGRFMLSQIGGNSVNIANLAKGVYVVRTSAGSTKFVR